MNYKLFLGLAALLMVLGPAGLVYGATIKSGEIVALPRTTPVLDDLYAGAGQVTIQSPVNGDIVAAGGKVLVDAQVTSDVMLAGGNVDLLGRVGDDARIAGGQIVVGSDIISGDLVAAGGSIHVLPGTQVRTNLLLAGGDIIVEGSVSGNAKIYAGSVTINGPIDGNVEIRSAKKVSFGPDAKIKGDLTYTAPESAGTSTDQVVLGKVTYTQTPMSNAEAVGVAAGAATAFAFMKFLVYLVCALLLLWVFKRYVTRIATEAVEHTAQHAVLGFAGLVVVPVAVVVLFITLIGIPFGFLGLFSYIALIILSSMMASIVTGALLSHWFRKEMQVTWQWTVIGALVLLVLSFIPVVGWIGVFVAFLVTFGAMLSILYRRFWLTR